ncbi:MerR family transcriptional regulator [Streptomyces sp.]|uniref:MerR family transcriptional regulator n=1 Tax=Streptomyces sp. TaxID=1931 RepID=UPI002D7A1DF2|nr:MerR family transcriptional regulator [Streptomyces sp.]HET6356919.1 MerR family transcriptional regulator [Streptomyces sp.]
MPTGHTGAGHRLYDIGAIARLEVVRTLRELDASLDNIRQLLAEETTLRDLATAHLGLIERQMRRLRARRAVLQTIVNQHTATEQVSLMHKLVSMSDDDRDRLIDEFWDEVSDGTEPRPRRAFVEELRQARPKLPEEPTTEQLEAWIELADLVQDPDFRRVHGKLLQEHPDPVEYRREYIQAYHQAVQKSREALQAGVPTTSRPTRAELEQRMKKEDAFVREAHAAYQAGLATDSPQAQDLANRYVAWQAEVFGVQDHAEMRRRMAAAFHTNVERQRAKQVSPGPGPRLSELHRYRSLVATINGEPQAEEEQAARGWLMEAICAPGSHNEPTTEN